MKGIQFIFRSFVPIAGLLPLVLVAGCGNGDVRLAIDNRRSAPIIVYARDDDMNETFRNSNIGANSRTDYVVFKAGTYNLHVVQGGSDSLMPQIFPNFEFNEGTYTLIISSSASLAKE